MILITYSKRKTVFVRLEHESGFHFWICKPCVRHGKFVYYNKLFRGMPVNQHQTIVFGGKDGHQSICF